MAKGKKRYAFGDAEHATILQEKYGCRVGEALDYCGFHLFSSKLRGLKSSLWLHHQVDKSKGACSMAPDLPSARMFAWDSLLILGQHQ